MPRTKKLPFTRPHWSINSHYVDNSQFYLVDNKLPACGYVMADFSKDSDCTCLTTGTTLSLSKFYTDEPTFHSIPVSDYQRKFLKTFRQCIIKCTPEYSTICLDGYDKKRMKWTGKESITLDETLDIPSGLYRCGFLFEATRVHKLAFASSFSLDVTGFGSPGIDRQSMISRIKEAV